MYLNDVKIIGNVGKNPVTSADGKKPFAMFDVATSEQYTTKGEKAEKVTETDWHKVKCYGKVAEIASQLVSQGSRVLICGKVKNDEWTDKDGQKHKSYSLLASKVILLDRKNDSQVASEE